MNTTNDIEWNEENLKSRTDQIWQSYYEKDWYESSYQNNARELILGFQGKYEGLNNMFIPTKKQQT